MNGAGNNGAGRAFRLGQSIANIAAEAERRQRTVRVMRATVVMIAVLASGTWGFFTLTDGVNSPLTCLYMTVLTVSTVGFQEVIPANSDSLRLFTMGLILLGGGSILYFLTSVTAVVMEGDLLYRFWRRRMARRLERLRDHVIVAGIGRTGLRAFEELWPARGAVLVIEHDAARLESAVRMFGENILFIVGDALDEESLTAARIDRARGLVATLPDDRENLFLCVTAKQLNPRMRIVSKVVERGNGRKFSQMGVNVTVNPAAIGGRRLANEIFRPGLMAFTDQVLASESVNKSLASIPISAAAAFAGESLSKAQLGEQTGCLIMGLRFGEDGPYRYHPEEDAVLRPGSSVIALGYPRQLRRLRRLLSSRGAGR